MKGLFSFCGSTTLGINDTLLGADPQAKFIGFLNEMSNATCMNRRGTSSLPDIFSCFTIVLSGK